MHRREDQGSHEDLGPMFQPISERSWLPNPCLTRRFCPFHLMKVRGTQGRLCACGLEKQGRTNRGLTGGSHPGPATRSWRH